MPLVPLAPPIFLESPPNFRLITRNPFSLHCVWGQHWIFCANNVQSLINNLINTWNIRFSKKMCYFNTKSNEFSWFTHICCKTLSSWFTHFFRQIFGAEILAPPKVLLLECMQTGKIYLFKLKNIFVQIINYGCQNSKIHLSKYTCQYTCQNCLIYFSHLFRTFQI